VASPIQNPQGELKRGRASHSEATKESSSEAKPLFQSFPLSFEEERYKRSVQEGRSLSSNPSPSPLKKRDTKGAFKRGEASLP